MGKERQINSDRVIKGVGGKEKRGGGESDDVCPMVIQ